MTAREVAAKNHAIHSVAFVTDIEQFRVMCGCGKKFLDEKREAATEAWKKHQDESLGVVLA